MLKTSNYDDLSDAARGMLGFLVHSKEHVFCKVSTDERMEEVLAKHSEVYNKPLYRGIRNKQELQDLLDGKPTSHYTSYSESEKYASNFGTVVTVQAPIVAFNYSKYQAEEFEILKQSVTQEVFASYDGDYMIETAHQELEWVLGMGVKLKLIDKEKLIFSVE